MKRIIAGSSLLFSILLATPQAYAQESVDVIIRENGTERREVIDLPKSMTYPVDSLLSDWKAKNYIDLGKDCSTSTVNPQFSDSVYIDRLSRMPTIMEMPYNEIVRKFIDMYTGRLRNQVAFMLSACNFYMPIFEEALDTYGLPLELKYLPIIESALNPSAVSRAGASGLWQFMLNTGKIYGLESNSLVDERRDPIKATWAAARYLKDMYAILPGLEPGNRRLQLRPRHHQQSHPARRRQNGLLGNIQLSAQRNTRIRTRFYSRQLRNDVLLQAQYLPDGNQYSGRHRYHTGEPQPAFRTNHGCLRHRNG